MNKYIAIAALLTLTACATPIHTLSDGKGHTTQCGGSRAGSASFGAVGYLVQKSQDSDCVARAKAKGYHE